MDGLRVGLIGYGLAGRVFHAPLVDAAAGLRIDAVVTGNAARAGAVAAAYPGTAVVASVDELWARRPEVVVVASPNDSHVRLALDGLAHDAFVVVDKPLAVTLEEAERLVTAAPGGRLTVFQNRRWDDDMLTLRRLIAEGSLGRVHRFESRFERWRPAPREGAWREELTPEQGGGVLLDLGSHLVDQARTLFGPVASVYGEVRTLRSGVAADDECFLALRHESGVLSHLSAGAVSAHVSHRLRVLGDRAAFVTEGLDPQEDTLRSGGRPGQGWLPTRTGWLGTAEAAAEVPLEPGNYLAFYEAVAAAAAGRGDVPVEPADALAAVYVLQAARRSARRGAVIDL